MPGRSGPLPTGFLEAVFPDVRSDVREGVLSGSDAAKVAIRYVQARWPSVHCAFMFGSVASSEFRPYSDIDVLVFIEKASGQSTFREVFEGVPIEAHLTDRKHYAQELRQAEATGIPNTAFVVIDGLVLIDKAKLADRYRQAASNMHARGPLPLRPEGADYIARNVSKKIVDLLFIQSATERQIVGAALRDMLFHAHFVSQGSWRYTGKWAARIAPVFAERLSAAVRDAELSNEFDALIDLARETLSSLGSFRWSDRSLPQEMEQNRAFNTDGAVGK